MPPTLAAECIYKRRWAPRSAAHGHTASASTASSTTLAAAAPAPATTARGARPTQTGRSNDDDAKLIFGTVFSLRNMVRKLGGADDSFLSYRTNQYKLHYYETPTNIKFVMLTDVNAGNMTLALQQIYVQLYVEY
ncbi:TRAPP subunit bet5, partial [Ascosphaera acerosa]